MRDSLHFTLFQQEFFSTQHIGGELLIHVPLRRAVHPTFVFKVVHENFSVWDLVYELRRCHPIDSRLSWLSLLHLVLLSQKRILRLLSVAILRLYIRILVWLALLLFNLHWGSFILIILLIGLLGLLLLLLLFLLLSYLFSLSNSVWPLGTSSSLFVDFHVG